MALGSEGAADDDRLWTREHAPFIVSVLALMTFIAFEYYAVTTVLPVAMTDLQGQQWYALAYASTITSALVGMVVGGNWADRSGPRLALLVGGTVFLLGLALCVLAPGALAFVLGRILQGVGGGLDSVVLFVMIARHIPDRPRPRMFGLLSTAWIIPSLVGPVIAGALTTATSWRTVFAIILAGSAVSLASLLVVTRGDTAERRTGTRLIGRNGLLSIVAALLLLTLHFGGQAGSSAPALIVVPAALALVVIARGILPRGTLALRGAPQRLVAIRALLGASFMTSDVYLTLYLQTERGYAPTMSGLVIAAGACGWALAAFIQGRLSSTPRTHRRIIIVATALVVLGPVSIAAFTTVGGPIGMVVTGCALAGSGMGMAYPRLSSATLSLARPTEQGAYSSALQAGESMAVGATTGLTAVILASALSVAASFGLVYAVLGMLALGAVAIGASTDVSSRDTGPAAR